MLSILNPPRIKRVCQQRRLTRYIADYVGRFYWHLFGYAAYYLVRKNFAGDALSYRAGFSRGDLGFALSGISIAYGFSKFIGIGLTARIRAFSCRLA